MNKEENLKIIKVNSAENSEISELMTILEKF